jgi:addiction module RelE/StbE family toxin
MELQFSPKFLKKYNKLSEEQQEEVDQKIELFIQDQKHPFLKTHKLKGKLKGYNSFSVNYKDRIIFEYESKTLVSLLNIGDHKLYR